VLAPGPERAIGVGVRRHRVGAIGRAVAGVGAGLLVGLAAFPAGAGAAGAGSGGAGSGGAGLTGPGFVGYPSYLPKSTLHAGSDTVLVGTPGRPALTSEGDAVKVVTAHWSARVTVSGPEVPGEGLPYQTPVTTCTWTVRVSRVSGRVPISAAAFASLDQRGHQYRPTLVPGQPAPPAMLGNGQSATFELRAAEPVGEGLMRWAPTGGHIVAKWDFVVEND
jgi:hypothetical protein